MYLFQQSDEGAYNNHDKNKLAKKNIWSWRNERLKLAYNILSTYVGIKSLNQETT